jgi:hypothetical protein
MRTGFALEYLYLLLRVGFSCLSLDVNLIVLFAVWCQTSTLASAGGTDRDLAAPQFLGNCGAITKRLQRFSTATVREFSFLLPLHRFEFQVDTDTLLSCCTLP